MTITVRMIQWNRSEDESCESKCGRFQVHPQYMGCTTAQCYTAYVRGVGKIRTQCDTQREAKDACEDWLNSVIEAAIANQQN